jgi:hypothetical protein
MYLLEVESKEYYARLSLALLPRASAIVDIEIVKSLKGEGNLNESRI